MHTLVYNYKLRFGGYESGCNVTCRTVAPNDYRVATALMENGEILQEQHYYPYGLTMGGLNYTSDVLTELDYGRDPHLYTAKELTEQDLNLYNFGARWYDMSLGRWMVHDPKYQFASPYLAMGNNPVSQIDPDGGASGIPGMYVAASELNQLIQINVYE